MKKALIIYHSCTGNTEMVAQAVRLGLEVAGIEVTVKKSQQAREDDWYMYDLVCVGSPSIQWHPAKPVEDLLKTKFEAYRKLGRIKPSAPKIPDKKALIFITYSGPHTGLDEATPTGKYIAQFFKHLGFQVIGE